jgi:hypothetical protein
MIIERKKIIFKRIITLQLFMLKFIAAISEY